MSWIATIIAALTTAAAAGAGTMWLAMRCVDWYRIPSREGQSGYYVVFLTAGGALGGLIIGAIASRILVAYWPDGRAGWLLGAPLAGIAAAAAILGFATILAWLRADIPPTRNGNTLDLAVEIRLPPGAVPPSDEPQLSLASVDRARHVQRKSEQGQCIVHGARRDDDGRWIIPGRVPIFTQRGMRILRVNVGAADEAFFVPLPARPKNLKQDWSDWLPRPRRDGGPAINTLGYRFRVEPSAA